MHGNLNRVTNAVELAKKKIEENKNLLIEKKNELTDLNCRIDEINKCIEELDKKNTNELKLEAARDIENEKVKLLAEEKKLNLFKELNILNNNLSLNGNSNTSPSSIDNLINCLYDVSQNRFAKIYLTSGNVQNQKQDGIDRNKLIAEVKEYILIDGQNEITQSKIDEICNRITEINKQPMPKCLLLDKKNKTLISSPSMDEKTVFLYKHKENYLILMSDTEPISSLEKSHELINNLLCEELLFDLCKIKLKESKGNKVEESTLEVLCNVIKEVKSVLNINNEDPEKLFLNHLKLKKADNVIEKIIESQITQLFDLYGALEKNVEHESMKLGIQLLKESYLKRMDKVLFDECENRKKKAELKIKLEFNDNDEIKKNIRKKENQIIQLDKEISKKQDELVKKSKEIDMKKEQLELLVETNIKQETQLNLEITKLKEDVKLKEQELENFKKESATQLEKDNQIRTQIKSIEAKINELNANKESLNMKRDQLSNSIEKAIQDRHSLESEKIKFEESKKSTEKELKHLNVEASNLEIWIQFIENVYDKFLNCQSLFSKRSQLNHKLFSNIKLIDIYNSLVFEEELSSKHQISFVTRL
jgi:hypothetical protein